jgi:regulator of replication initiation timing
MSAGDTIPPNPYYEEERLRNQVNKQCNVLRQRYIEIANLKDEIKQLREENRKLRIDKEGYYNELMKMKQSKAQIINHLHSYLKDISNDINNYAISF